MVLFVNDERLFLNLKEERVRGNEEDFFLLAWNFSMTEVTWRRVKALEPESINKRK